MTRTIRSTRVRFALAVVAGLALIIALSLVGCGAKTTSGTGATSSEATGAPQAAGTFPVTITDDASRTVEVKAQPVRIVSLAPGNTEILYALGLGDKVVGVTTYDDYPAEVKDKPKVGDFVTPNIEAIAGAKPDLIVATTGVQGDVLAKLEALGAPVLAIDPTSLDGLYTDIDRIGQATGATAESAKVVADMKAKADAIQAKIGQQEPKTVFVEIGQDPLYTVGEGTLLADLVKRAGGENVVTKPGYVAYSLEELVKADPAVYLATKGSMSDPSALAKRAGYDKLTAVVDGSVYVLDDNLVTRPGPRTIEGLESIAKVLYPEGFSN